MSDSLGHRERVLRSLEGQSIDRVPAFFRAEAPVRQRLKKELGLSADMDLVRHFDTDAVHVEVSFRKELFRQDSRPDYFYDMFGNLYHSVQNQGVYSEAVAEPVLAGVDNSAEIQKVRWPDKSIIDFDACLSRARAARETGLAVYGGIWASIFTHSRAMLGEEDYLAALVVNPELIAALVDRLTDCFLELNRAYLDKCAKYLDVYYFGSDFGAQDSLIISPEMFRRFYKDNLARLAGQARAYGLKVMYHSCGAVSQILPDLLDCGIDVLDPVQVSARGMSAGELAAGFKGRIAFHGGISTQTTLPGCSPEEVRFQVFQAIRQLGPGGYVCAPDQNLMEDIPTVNIEALYRAIKEYKL